MAVTIIRTAWIDDDGTGTTGTVINNAVKTDLYNQIDGALAKVAQLAGGNSFTGDQYVTGNAQISGSQLIMQNAAGATCMLNVTNPLAGSSNSAEISIGNDVQSRLLILQAFASTFATSGTYVANGVTMTVQGSGGFTLAGGNAPIRVYTNGVERLRVTPTGELLIGLTAANACGMMVATDATAVKPPLVVQNVNPASTGNLITFVNSAFAVAGGIAQVSATSVAYNTSSDQRLKTDDGRATDVSALRALVVHDFTWKADGIRDRGIFAQEAHALYPRAVQAGTDETTDGGALARPWMTDYSKFVPDLIVGWQQHAAELAALRAQLATLKGSPDAQ